MITSGPQTPTTLNNNTEHQALIKSLSCRQRINGTYYVLVTSTNKNASKAIADFCHQNRFPLSSEFDTFLSFECTDPDAFAYFIQQVVAYDNNALVSERDEIFQRFSLAAIANYQIPTWLRVGNHDVTYDSGADLNRSVEYRNTLSGCALRSLWIGGYKNHSVQVYVEPKDDQAFNNIAAALEAAGFPSVQPIDKLLGRIRFTNHNKTLIAHFLAVVGSVEKSFPEIKHRIENALDVNLEQSFTKHTWISTGRFEEVTFSHRHDLTRQMNIEYTDSKQSPLRSITLLGYKDGSLKINVTLKEKHDINELIAKTNAMFPGLTLDSSFFKQTMYFAGNDNNALPFLSVLQFIKSITGDDFREIEPVLLNALKISMRSIFEQNVQKLKVQKVTNAKTPHVPETISQPARKKSIKERMGIFVGKVKQKLGIVRNKVESVADELCSTVTDAVEDLGAELEKLVLDTDLMINDVFDELEKAVTPAFSAMKISDDSASQAKPPSYQEAMHTKTKVKNSFRGSIKTTKPYLSKPGP